MGDLASVFVPPATTASTPATEAAGPAARCRRVHFPSSSICRLPTPTDDGNPMAEEAGPEKETGADEPAEEEDSTMDLLWEDFNEELLAMHRGTRGSVSFSSVSSSSDDGEESGSELAHAPGAGCFPVLRPSARAAGGAGHYRRRAGTWVLLVRIFRRLFVIDKTTVVDSSAVAASSRHATSSAAP